MTQLDAAKSLTSLSEQLIGMWLGTHLELPSMSPGAAGHLMEMARKIESSLVAENDPVITLDVRRFIDALRFIGYVELVHQAVIIDSLSRTVNVKEGPDA